MRNFLLTELPSTQVTATRSAVTEFLDKIVNQNIASFDPHISIADAFAGESELFENDVYSRLGWFIDESVIVGELKKLGGILPLPVGGVTLDHNAELQNTLDEMYEGENHGYENGLSGTGPLHKIVAALNIRDRWHNLAKQASNKLGREYSVKEIPTRIGMPAKQQINTNHINNAKFEGMRQTGMLTSPTQRVQFDVAINHLNDIASIDRAAFDANAKLPANQIKSEDLVRVDLENNEERKAILAKLATFDNAVRAGAMIYAKLINDQEDKFEKFYQNDLKKIPNMLYALDFCQRKLLVEEFSTEWNELPVSIRTAACTNIGTALDNTLAKFSGKANYVYSQLSLRVEAAKRLLDRVVVAAIEE